MNILRETQGFKLNEGNMMSSGLFNISTGEGNDTKVSFWFDEDTKDDLLSMSDEEFVHDAKAYIEHAQSNDDEPSFYCQNCGDGFTREEMDFDDDSDLCKNCVSNIEL